MSQPSKTQHVSAALSLLLPGLGHIYLGRRRRGLGLFAAFLLLTFIPEGRLFLPFAAILAAAEIYRPVWRLDSKRELLKARQFAFGFTGIAAFFAWFTLFASVVFPFAYQATVNADVDRIADLVRHFRAENGVLPADLNEVVAPSGFKQNQKDPWGREYEIVRQEQGFLVRSLGPDGKPDTGDDLRFSFR